MSTAVETAVQEQPELLQREKHDSPADSNSLDEKYPNEKEEGVYTHQAAVNGEDPGDVYEDVRAIDLDDNGKERPIGMYTLHSPLSRS